MKLLRVLVLLASAVALASGCVLPGSDVELVVELPPLPTVWVDAWGPAEYEVFVRSQRTDRTSAGTAKVGRTISIRVPRDPPVVVSAVATWRSGGPALATGESLEPAAGIWPYQLHEGAWYARGSGRLPLSFENAPAARVLCKLFDLRADLREFNVRRFVEEAASALRAGALELDTERIIRAIAGRSMRASYLRGPEVREIRPGLPDGMWLRDSHRAPPVEGGGESRVGLAQGLTAFYSDDGQRVPVWVDEEWRPSTGAP